MILILKDSKTSNDSVKVVRSNVIIHNDTHKEFDPLSKKGDHEAPSQKFLPVQQQQKSRNTFKIIHFHR